MQLVAFKRLGNRRSDVALVMYLVIYLPLSTYEATDSMAKDREMSTPSTLGVGNGTLSFTFAYCASASCVGVFTCSDGSGECRRVGLGGR